MRAVVLCILLLAGCAPVRTVTATPNGRIVNVEAGFLQCLVMFVTYRGGKNQAYSVEVQGVNVCVEWAKQRYLDKRILKQDMDDLVAMQRGALR